LGHKTGKNGKGFPYVNPIEIQRERGHHRLNYLGERERGERPAKGSPRRKTRKKGKKSDIPQEGGKGQAGLTYIRKKGEKKDPLTIGEKGKENLSRKRWTVTGSSRFSALQKEK